MKVTSSKPAICQLWRQPTHNSKATSMLGITASATA
jgi:hypothetical protein